MTFVRTIFDFENELDVKRKKNNCIEESWNVQRQY